MHYIYPQLNVYAAGRPESYSRTALLLVQVSQRQISSLSSFTLYHCQQKLKYLA
jgi:hypothetical protein